MITHSFLPIANITLSYLIKIVINDTYKHLIVETKSNAINPTNLTHFILGILKTQHHDKLLNTKYLIKL
jgi:hypothetical protein